MNKISSTNSAKAEATASTNLYSDFMQKRGWSVGEEIDYAMCSELCNHELVTFDDVTSAKIASKGSRSLLPFLLRNAYVAGKSCYGYFKQAVSSQELLEKFCRDTLDCLEIQYNPTDVSLHCKVYMHFLKKRQEAKQDLKESTASTAE